MESSETKDLADLKFLTPAQAAGLLNIGKSSIYDAVRRGEIPHIRVGITVRIPRDRFCEKFGIEL